MGYAGCVVLFVFSLTITISMVQCSDEISLVIDKISKLDEELLDMRNNLRNELFSVRNDFSRIEDKIFTTVEFAKISLRSEMKKHIKQQVKEAMVEILHGESLEEIVRSHVVSEVRKLKHGHHQMKR